MVIIHCLAAGNEADEGSSRIFGLDALDSIVQRMGISGCNGIEWQAFENERCIASFSAPRKFRYGQEHGNGGLWYN